MLARLHLVVTVYRMGETERLAFEPVDYTMLRAACQTIGLLQSWEREEPGILWVSLAFSILLVLYRVATPLDRAPTRRFRGGLASPNPSIGDFYAIMRAFIRIEL